MGHPTQPTTMTYWRNLLATSVSRRLRDRDELLVALSARRSGTHPAGRVEAESFMPLEDCLDSFFAFQSELPSPSPVVAPSDSLLDQVPAVDVAVRVVALVDLLRAAYVQLGRP